MRSISNFPTGQNRKRGRRIPNNNNSTDNNRNGWNQSAPVWGRSAAAVVAISSSPSNSSFGSDSSGNRSSRSLSRSPANPSPVWGRSLQAPVATSRSPSQTGNARLAKNTDYYDQQRGLLPTRSRSHSPQSPVAMDDYRDEVTTSTPMQQLLHHQEQTLLIPQKVSSSPRRPRDLCTIAEDRKISSNTLSQMAVTSTAEEIAKSPVLAKRRPQQQQRRQQNQLGKNQRMASPKLCDPYNDETFDDSRDQDCTDCWAYQKSRFKNWWPFGNHFKAIRNNNRGIISNQVKEIGPRPIRGRTAGFSAVHRRVHVRRISF